MSELSRETYFNWLCKLIGVENPPIDASYWLMLKRLFKIPFVVLIPMDQNRAMDGERLREEYVEETGVDLTCMNAAEASILEVLIALAFRCQNDILYDPNGEDKTKELFWEMLDSCGLTECKDEGYDQSKVDYICSVVLNRTYQADGTGGLFPLKNPLRDQRTVELWYQMQAYVQEKYET